jgi:hypothetical protein
MAGPPALCRMLRVALLGCKPPLTTWGGPGGLLLLLIILILILLLNLGLSCVGS